MIGVEVVKSAFLPEPTPLGPFVLNVRELAEPDCPEPTLLTGELPIVEEISVLPQSDSSLNCEDWPSSELAYTLRAPKAGTYIIAAENPERDVTLRVSESSCALEPLGCSYGYGRSGGRAELVRELAQDELVHVRVGTPAEPTDWIQLSMIEIEALGSAGSCEAPAEVVVGDKRIGITGAGTVEDVCTGRPAKVMRFVPERSGVYYFFGNWPFSVAIGDCSPDAAVCEQNDRYFLEAGQPAWIFADATGSYGESLSLSVRESTTSCSSPESFRLVDSANVTVLIPSPAGQASEVDASCAEPGAAEGVVRFFPKYPGKYRFATPTSAADTTLYVLDGHSCDEPQIACGLSQEASGASVDVELAEAENVAIVVETTAEANTAIQLQALLIPPGCQDARELDIEEGYVPVPIGTRGGNNEVSAECSNKNLNEAVFRFQAPRAGPYRFQLADHDAGATLYALTEDCNGQELACDEVTSGEEDAQIELMLEAGQTIAIVAEHNGERDSLALGFVDYSGCSAVGYSGTFDPEVEQCVCRLDQFCCEQYWDEQCVSEAVDWGCLVCPND